MKYCIFIIVVLFCIKTKSYCKTYLKYDDQIEKISQPKEIYANKSTLVNRLEFSIVTLKNNKVGIMIQMIVSKRTSQSIVRADSILFQSERNIENLNSPYRDTIFYKNSEKLFISVTHILSESSLYFFKNNAIKNIILIVDGKRLILKLKNCAQELIKMSL